MRKRVLTLLMQRVQACVLWSLLDDDVVYRVRMLFSDFGVQPPVQKIGGLMKVDLRLPLMAYDAMQVLRRLEWFGLVCDPEIHWVPERIFTAMMEELSESSLDAIGVANDTVTAIENHTGLLYLKDYLELPWSEITSWTYHKDEGGIQNFGEKSLKQFYNRLVEHGFVAESAGWIKHQDVPILCRQQLASVLRQHKEAEPFAREMMPDLFKLL